LSHKGAARKDVRAERLFSNNDLTINQLEDIVKTSELIIDNLDEDALRELSTGTEQDVIDLFYDIVLETNKVIINREGKIKSSSFDYLDKLSDNIDDFLRRENFAYFIQSTLSSFIMNWHHLQWCDYVHNIRQFGIICSRNGGKSYFFSRAYPLWKMYQFKTSTQFKPQPLKIQLCQKGMLFTNEMGLAEDLLADIKADIETYDVLRESLYNPRGDNWSKRSIKCKNGAQFQLKSYGSRARGRHPGYIIIDDFLSDAVLYSQDQNTKIKHYFESVILNMPLKNGQVIIVGTPYKHDDLYAELKKRKDWFIFEYPAIFPDGSLLWEDRFSYRDLVVKKDNTTNLVFSREILCKPISSDASIFPYETLAKCFDSSFKLVNSRINCPIKFERVVLGCDFAISSTVAADYAVFLTLGRDAGGRYYILNITRLKGKSYNEQIAVIKSLHMAFNYDVVMMETNSFQTIYKQDVAASSMNIPVVGEHTGVNKNDLKEGVPGLSLLFENLKIVIPRGDQFSIDQTDIMIGEACSIAFTDSGLKSVGGHDDIMMALWQSTKGMKFKSFNYDFI